MRFLLHPCILTAVAGSIPFSQATPTPPPPNTLRGGGVATGPDESVALNHRGLVEPADFGPLSCNARGTLTTTTACVSWTSQFGTAAMIPANRVVVPCGVCLRMDHPGPVLTLVEGLDIQGKLLFPDGLRLEVRSPLIVVQGELELQSFKPVDGTPNIRFVLTGETDQTFAPVYENANACHGGLCTAGKKAIVVAGGRVNVRGLPPNTPTWLRLYDVSPDRTSIVVDASVSGKWAPGAELLITSHLRQWDGHQLRNITSVDGAVSDPRFVRLTLNAPIDRPTTTNDSPDFAVEVALLSRNIVFASGVDSQSAHGAHFWVFHTPKVKQYIEGVDFQNFGQQGSLGRYPIHFHLCRDVTGSIVAKNTIRFSHQRCIVVHGTDNLRVEENVAYNTKGHCYMLEDGIETGNHFIRNIGAHTAIPRTLIPNLGSNGIETDNEPSTFWITNPSNTWIGNVAAGSERAGFWMELKVRGPRAAQFGPQDPKRGILTLFQDNVAHSNAVHGMRTYPTGYTPDKEAILLGAKCYRNTFGLFIHNSRNVTVSGGLFADNMIGVDIDRDDTTKLVNSKIIGESDSYRALMLAKRLSEKVCLDPHIGVELHTELLTPQSKGIAIENVEFSKFSHIRCNDAVPFQFDPSTQSGLFDSFTATRGLTFVENDGDIIDFCQAKAANVANVYLTDLDGSLRPPSVATSGTSTLVIDQPNLLSFIDQTKCTPQDTRCYKFCRSTCFRTVRFVVEPAGSYRLKVCRRGSQANCIFISGFTRSEDATFAKRPREFVAHLPQGVYDAVFVNSVGTNTWPGFVNVAYDTAACPEALRVEDVALIVPNTRPATSTQPPECTSLIKNGNFEGSRTVPTLWLHNSGGIKLAVGGGLGGTNGASSVVTSPLSTLIQFVDNRCIKTTIGQWYHLQASIKLQNNDGSAFICNREKQSCPDIGVHTSDDGFVRVSYVSMTSVGNGFFAAQGFLQIDNRLSDPDSIAMYIRSGIDKLMTVDDVSMRLQVHANYCRNIILGANMEDVKWLGVWAPNVPNLAGVTSLVSPGFNSNLAMRYSRRSDSNSVEGPTYLGFRNIDLACLTPGSTWRIVAQIKLVNRVSGQGVGCDVTKRDDCPSIRISIRNGEGNRFFAEQYRAYGGAAAVLWNVNGFNKFQADFMLPSRSTWDGRIKTMELTIRDFPSAYDVIWDDASLSPVV